MLKNKFIHIFNDDKFIDPTIKLLERIIPGQSVYIVITNKNTDFKYVTSSLVQPVVLKNNRDLLAFADRINTSENKGVFFHALDDFKIQIADNLNDAITKVWFIWGYDLYNIWGILKKRNYTKETKKVLEKVPFSLQFKNLFLFNQITFSLYLKSLKGSLRFPSFIQKVLDNNFNTNYYRVIQKMNIVVPVLPNEYETIKKMNVKAKYAPFTYGCIEDLLGENLNKNVLNQQHILVGNSADPANNHIDVLKHLGKINLGERKVYVPLSYGGNVDYINHILKIGKKELGENFVPLKSYMTLEKYNEILLSCGTVIFNHIRQQGVGNIIIAGYLGAKIYLNKKSPAYSYYKSIGMTIFENKSFSDKSIKAELTADEMHENRKILMDKYALDAVQKKVEVLTDIVLKASQSKK